MCVTVVYVCVLVCNDLEQIRSVGFIAVVVITYREKIMLVRVILHVFSSSLKAFVLHVDHNYDVYTTLLLFFIIIYILVRELSPSELFSLFCDLAIMR